MTRIAVPLLAASVLLLAIVGGFFYGRAWSTDRARIADLLAERAQYEGLLRDAPAMKREVERLRASPQEKTAFVPPGAAPDVQARIAAIVSAGGGVLRHVSVELKTEGDEAPVELSANLSFSADMGGVTRILYGLRQARPYLFVTRLAMRRAAPNRLDVDLTTVSYVRAP